MSILIKEDKFRKIITLLDAEIVKLENIYNEIDDEAKKLDGNNEIWQGKTQTVVYDYYESIKAGFPDTIDRIKSFSTYLKTTLDNYINGENSINSDVDNNKENLIVN